MSREQDIITFQGEQVNVGVSAIVGVAVIPGQVSAYLKNSSGGTLWIGVTAGGGWGTGYAMSAAEVVNLGNFAGTLYMVGAGATVVTYLLRGRSSGV
jgi:hypothetical protein